MKRILTIAGIIAGLAFATLALQACRTIERTEVMMGLPGRPTTIQEFLALGERPRVIAHRGFSGKAPENTAVAFQMAIDRGADAIELDVLLSKDGRVVVIHDDTLDRTTDGKGAVADHTWDELRKLDAGSWFAPEFAGEPLPLLDDVLDQVKGRILLNIEIKSEAVTETIPGGIAEKVVELVNARGMRDEIVVSSFHPLALRQIRELDPDMKTAMLYNDDRQKGQTPTEIVKEIGGNGFNLSQKEVTPEIVKECHEGGWPVAVYTVNDAPTMRAMIDMGVDALFTNEPGVMIDLLRAGE